jgi:hypothetical protein
MRLLWIALAGLWFAGGCTSVMLLESEEHPAESELRIWADCKHDDEYYWTEVTIRNHSDEDVLLEPQSFEMYDGKERPLHFAAWSHFGGHRFTTSRPRHIRARKSTFGTVRWVPVGSWTDRVRLEIEIEGERHTFDFVEP